MRTSTVIARSMFAVLSQSSASENLISKTLLPAPNATHTHTHEYLIILFFGQCLHFDSLNVTAMANGETFSRKLKSIFEMSFEQCRRHSPGKRLLSILIRLRDYFLFECAYNSRAGMSKGRNRERNLSTSRRKALNSRFTPNHPLSVEFMTAVSKKNMNFLFSDFLVTFMRTNIERCAMASSHVPTFKLK